jgi:hypothetical protein
MSIKEIVFITTFFTPGNKKWLSVWVRLDIALPKRKLITVV